MPSAYYQDSVRLGAITALGEGKVKRKSDRLKYLLFGNWVSHKPGLVACWIAGTVNDLRLWVRNRVGLEQPKVKRSSHNKNKTFQNNFQ